MKKTTSAVDYKQINVASPAFQDGRMIPDKYAREGENINPPLDIAHIPDGAVCLALTMTDTDAPGGDWTHWLAWNIPVTHHIRENDVHGMQGVNDFLQCQYIGPCPPEGIHRYQISIYALDALLDLPVKTKKNQLEKEMSAHIIGFGQLMGLYAKNDRT
jgi:Raf kinase inhibitor-like YbhB/YbcL family protein